MNATKIHFILFFQCTAAKLTPPPLPPAKPSPTLAARTKPCPPPQPPNRPKTKPSLHRPQWRACLRRRMFEYQRTFVTSWGISTNTDHPRWGVYFFFHGFKWRRCLPWCIVVLSKTHSYTHKCSHVSGQLIGPLVLCVGSISWASSRHTVHKR